MKTKIFLFVLLGCIFRFSGIAQHSITINATLYPEEKTVRIAQELVYHNTSDQVLSKVLLHDWNNSFSSKSTPLGDRFAEDFFRKFHFAKQEERGFTTIGSVTDSIGSALTWDRLKNAEDIIAIQLPKKLHPDHHLTIKLQYELRIPDAKFTRFG